MHEFGDLPDLFDRKAVPQSIPARTLKIYHAHIRARGFAFDGGEVERIVFRKLHLTVLYAEIFKRPLARAFPAVNADGRKQRVVGRACDAQHHVAGAQHAIKADRQGVCPAGKRPRANERALRAENVRRELIQFLAPAVGIAIARGRAEIRFVHTVLDKSRQHTTLVVFRLRVDLLKLCARIFERRSRRLFYCIRKCKKIPHDFMFPDPTVSVFINPHLR